MLLKATNITKAFHGNVVLHGVDFDVRPGEVHALIGENGAGKSTLVNILSGNLVADAGEVSFDGKRVAFTHPLDAMQAGISVVHQELSLVPNATVAENIYLRREIRTASGLNDWSAMFEAASGIFDRMGVDIDPRALVGSLSIGMQQLVEVAKAIALNARLIFMDEPTSSLSEKEIRELFAVVRELRQQGMGVVFISHKLSELFEISDRITVLRDGRLVGTRDISDVSTDDVIAMMVGRSLDELYPVRSGHRGERVLKCTGLSRFGAVRDVTFEVHAGEILGVAGLIGSGRTEAMRALVGADPRLSGQFEIDGRTVEISSPADALDAGIVYVSEDRKQSGLFLSFDVAQNVSASVLGAEATFGFLGKKPILRRALDFIDRMDIRPRSAASRAIDLSGGNQQKVLLSKALATEPRVLIVDEPTRGVDIGAKALIHRRLRELAEAGIGVVIVSSEMPEVLGMADRVIVFRDGLVTANLDNHDGSLSAERVLKAAVQ